MKHLVALFLVAVIMVFLYGQIDYTVAPYKDWDLASYRMMAAAAPGIAADVCQPPAYRLLGPYLVGLLPVPDPVGFYAAVVAGSLALVFLAYRFFRDFGLSAPVAALVVILFTFNRFWFGLTVWDFFQLNDLLALVFIVILFGAMRRGHWLLFGVAFFLAALARETGLLMLPVVAVYLWERGELAAKWKVVLASVVPGLAAFLLIRVLVPAPCGKPLFEQLAAHSSSILSLEKVFRLLINSYLPFSLLPLVFLPVTARYFKGRWHALVFVALVFLSTLFGATFDERLLAPAFLVIYAIIGLALEGLGRPKPLIAALLIGGFLASLHHTTARFPLPDRAWTLAISLASLAVVTIVALYYQGMGRRLN